LFTSATRRVLVATMLGVVLILAGCMATGPSASPGTDQPRASSSSRTTAAGCTLPETQTVTTTTATPTSSGTGQLPGGVSITSTYDGTLSVVLVYEPEGADVTTLARRYEDGRSPGNLGPEMVDWADYRVVIRADCEVVWDRTVNDYESIDLRIGEDGNVEIVGFGEA